MKFSRHADWQCGSQCSWSKDPENGPKKWSVIKVDVKRWVTVHQHTVAATDGDRFTASVEESLLSGILPVCECNTDVCVTPGMYHTMIQILQLDLQTSYSKPCLFYNPFYAQYTSWTQHKVLHNVMQFIVTDYNVETKESGTRDPALPATLVRRTRKGELWICGQCLHRYPLRHVPRLLSGGNLVVYTRTLCWSHRTK